MLILAGCGGDGQSNQHWQTVTRQGVHFRAPADWEVTVANGRTTARDGASFVQVATFPLVKRYDDALFDQVARELTVRMRAVAAQTGGQVTGTSTVTAAGIRSHAYDVTVGDHVDQYTFVLRGKREYQLLCSAQETVCARLLTSFDAG